MNGWTLFMDFHVGENIPGSYGNPMGYAKSSHGIRVAKTKKKRRHRGPDPHDGVHGSGECLKLFEVAGVLGGFGSSKMTPLHLRGRGFLGFYTFFGAIKTSTISDFQKQKKNFRLLQFTSHSSPPTCWKICNLQRELPFRCSQLVFFPVALQTSESPGNPRFIDVKHPRRQYRETPIERTRRFLFILYVSLELGQQMGVSMQTVQELW